MPNDSSQLKPYLDSLPTDNNTRAAIWDSIQGANNPQDFQKGMDSLSIPKEAKAALWDYKFSNANLTPFKAPSTAPQPSSPETPGPGTRFVQSFASNIGAPPKASDIVTGPAYLARHPVEGISLLYGGITSSMQETIAGGKERIAAGQPVHGAYEEMMGYIPIVGPALVQAGHQFEQKDIAGGLGSTAGLYAAQFGLHELGKGPEVNPEIAKLNTAGRTNGTTALPTLRPETKEAVAKAVEPKVDVPPEVAPSPAPEAPATSVLTDAKRAEISRMAQVAAANRARPPIAPEPTEDLSPAHQQIATAVEDQHQSALPQFAVAGATAHGTIVGTDLPNEDALIALHGSREAFERHKASVDRFLDEGLKSGFIQRIEQQFGSAGLSQPDQASAPQALPQMGPREATPQAAPAQPPAALAPFQPQLAPSLLSSFNQSQLRGLSTDQLSQLRDQVKQTAQDHAQRADLIRQMDTIRTNNQANADAAVRMKANGGPVREMVVNDETGERAVVKPESEVGPLARTLLGEGLGKIPQFKLEDIQRHPNPRPDKVTDETWNSLQDKIAANLQAKYLGLQRDIETLKDTGTALDDTDIPQRLKDLDADARMLGKFPEAKTGARPKVPIKIEDGKALPAPMQTPSLADWRGVFGTKLRKIPESAEALRAANKLDELARLYKAVGTAIDKQIGLKEAPRPGERGAIGEPALRPGRVAPLTFPEQSILQTRAKAQGIEMRPASGNRAPGARGWLAEDGKTWIGVSDYKTHDEVAAGLQGRPHAEPGDASSAMLNNGWIRKESPFTYQLGKPSSKAFNSIEMSSMYDGYHGRHFFIDVGEDVEHPRESVEIPAGWGERYKSLEAAFNANRSTRFDLGEAGALGPGSLRSGTEIAGGMAIGGALGAHVGGYPGMAVGSFIGAVTPAVLRTKFVTDAYARIQPVLDAARIGSKEWLMGKDQNVTGLSEDMKGILDYQKNHGADTLTLGQRMARLPGNVMQHFDRTVLINDRLGKVARAILSGDDRGTIFRAGNKPSPIEETPYMYAYTAQGRIKGEQAANAIAIRGIAGEAEKAGLYNQAQAYLNLKGYKRAYDNLNEDLNEHQSTIKSAQEKLAAGGLSTRDRIKLEDQLSDARSNLKDLKGRMDRGEVTPMGYTPDKIKAELSKLEEDLGPEKFQQVQGYADRMFKLMRRSLDLAHNLGVVGDAEYQKYVGRGMEYVPMDRILERANNLEERISGQSPLWLRRRQSIKELRGSEAVNVNPFEAMNRAAAELVREGYRNRVMSSYVADENASKLFTPVEEDYKAKPGESLVGIYVDGKPHAFSVPDWFGESLKGADPLANKVALSAVSRFMGHAYKAGVTALNPFYNLARIPTDMFEIATTSYASGQGMKGFAGIPKEVAKFPVEWAKNVYHSMAKDEEFIQFLRGGAAFGGFQMNITPEAFLDLGKLGFKGRVPRGLIDRAEQLSAAFENASKMTTYKHLRLQGWSEDAAAFEARRYGGLPDVSRGGDLTHGANLLAMFFNAHLQDITRTFSRLSEDPKKMGMLMGSLTAAQMSLAAWNWQQRDDKGEPIMRKIQPSVRDRNFIFLHGEEIDSTTGAKVPVYNMIRKPNVIRYLTDPLENMLNKVVGRETRAGWEIGKDAVLGLSPVHVPSAPGQSAGSSIKGMVSDLNPVAKVPIEQLGNFQGMYGTPIVTDAQSKRSPELQYGPSTDPTAIAIGRHLGLSPNRVQNFIQGTTGSLGQIAMAAAHPLVKPNPLQSEPRPLYTGFTGYPANAADQQFRSTFESHKEAAKQTLKDYQFLSRTDPATARSLLQQHPDLIAKGRLATTMDQKLSKIAVIQDRVRQNNALDEASKARVMNNLYEVRMRMMQAFDRVLSR